MSTTSRFWPIWAAPGLRRYFASWVGGDEIHFQRGVQVLGPVSEPSEDLRYFDPSVGRRQAAARTRPSGRQDAGRRREAVRAGGGEPVRGRRGCSPTRLHMPDEVARALGQLTERWDGKGVPGRGGGGDLPAAAHRPRRPRLRRHRPWRASGRRRSRRSSGAAGGATTRRSSTLRSPSPRRSCARRTFPTPGSASSTPSHSRSRRSRGRGWRRSPGRSASSPISSSTSCHGHSTRVAELAATRRRGARVLARRRLRRCAPRASSMTSAGWRCRTGSGTSPGPLSAGEQERVRLHPYYTERVLERSGALAPLALLSGSHHERLDGSGYHRGATAAQLSVGARLLAAADVYDAMTHDRPHRRALSPGGRSNRARRDGPRGRAREAGGRRRPGGGGRGTARGAPGLPGRAQRPRGRGPAPRRAGSNEQGDRRRRS